MNTTFDNRDTDIEWIHNLFMSRKSTLILTIILLLQICSYTLNSAPIQMDSSDTLSTSETWEVSGRNDTSDNTTAGGDDTGNNTEGNGSTGNNTAGNNSTTTIPDYYFDESFGIYFNAVSNIMNGTYVPTTVLIHNYENDSTTTGHMLAVTFYSDGHSEQKTTQYLVPPVSRNTISVSQYVYITSETTYVEVSMDVLECTDEYCDMSKTPEDRYYPADYQYYQSHNSTYIPRVVELMDEIYDLDDGEDIPRFTFEMEEIDLNGEMYYSIVVTSSQMNFATQCMEIIIHWIDANGESQMANWNLAYENGVYGFYPGNSNSTVTFADSVDSGDSATSSFGVGDNIFIKSEIENQISVGAIRIDYAPDDMTGIILRSWDFGGSFIIDDDDNSEDNTDDNDTEDDSESIGLPSIGIVGTFAAIGLSFVAVIRREQEE